MKFCSFCLESTHNNADCPVQSIQSLEELTVEISSISKAADEFFAAMPPNTFGNSSDEYGPFFLLRKGKPISDFEVPPLIYDITNTTTQKFEKIIKESLNILKPTPNSLHLRYWSIVKNVKLICSYFKDAICFAQGSVHTNTYLPTSDVDLVVFNVTAGDLLQFLEQMEEHVQEVELIKARVNIIKFLDIEANISYDISFENSSGYNNGARFLRYINNFPMIQPLTVVLKQILYYYECEDTFTGGINSTEIMNFILMFVKRQPELTISQYIINIMNFLSRTNHYKNLIFSPNDMKVYKRIYRKTVLTIFDNKDEKLIIGKMSKKSAVMSQRISQLLKEISKNNFKQFQNIMRFARSGELPAFSITVNHEPEISAQIMGTESMDDESEPGVLQISEAPQKIMFASFFLSNKKSCDIVPLDFVETNRYYIIKLTEDDANLLIDRNANCMIYKSFDSLKEKFNNVNKINEWQ